MQKILQIALRDVRLEFSSPMAWLTFLILPVVFTVIFAGQFSDGSGRGNSRSPGLPLLVVDLDQSALSAEFVEALTETDGINPELATAAEADEAYGDGALAALVIPAGFEARMFNGEALDLDLRVQPGSTSSQIMTQAFISATDQFSRPISLVAQSAAQQAELGRFETEAERRAWFESMRTRLNEEIEVLPPRIEATQPEEAAVVGFDVQSQQALGQLITWVFIPLIGASVLFISERQYGTLRRMLTTPTSKATYMGGVIFGQLAKGLVQMLILVLFGGLVFGIAYGRSPLGLAALLISFGLAGVALGTMLGTFARSDGQANGLSIMLGMVLALLGGCWFPLEFFPPAAKTVALFVPTRWALVGLTDVVVRGENLLGVLPETGVLLLFAAVFFAIGVWRFRYE
ncbi:MAG: ABC transporter permease [Chloroflexota bacterium]